MNDSALVVLCTAPATAPAPASASAAANGKLGAEALARVLVDEQWCACVNLVPAVRSVFRWQGAVDTADEVLLIVKTTRDAAPGLRRRLLELHPYEVPEVVELPIVGGSAAYLDWLRANVRSC